jgi:hypothetical protein
MTNFPALDVAIGLVFLYFILSLVCSAINETIASGLHWRSKDLERGIVNLLGSVDEQKLRAHPLIKAMIDPNRRHSYPSYIASRTFSAALLGLDYAQDALGEKRPIEESIGEIQNPEVRRALTALWNSSQGDAVKFRGNVERWYDDSMERVSGWYRRRVQKVLWVLAIGVVLAINADSFQIARGLWSDPTVRSALVNKADKATGQETGGAAVKELKSLPVPLGWHSASMRHDPQGFPFYRDWWMVWDFLTKVLGLGLTAVALTFGAPFWFDTLSKIARIRNSGAPPPASDAVRHGEGEETRGMLLVSQAPAAREQQAPTGAEKEPPAEEPPPPEIEAEPPPATES